MRSAEFFILINFKIKNNILEKCVNISLEMISVFASLCS